MSKYLLSLVSRRQGQVLESGGAPSLSAGIRLQNLQQQQQAFLPTTSAATATAQSSRSGGWLSLFLPSSSAGSKASPRGPGGAAAGRRQQTQGQQRDWMSSLSLLLFILAIGYILHRRHVRFMARHAAVTETVGADASESISAAVATKAAAEAAAANADSGGTGPTTITSVPGKTGAEALPASVAELVKNKREVMDPKIGMVNVKPIIDFEGGEGAAEQALAAEKAVFAKPPFRVSEQEGGGDGTMGYLFGWTVPELGYRIGLPDSSSNLPEHPTMGARRVGGVLRRLGVTAVASGRHTLAVALTPGGTGATGGPVYSWGTDWDLHGKPAGLLGRKGPFWRPELVEGIPEPCLDVAVGRFHSVAVTASGKVFTWGLNNRGQLGRPTDKKEEGFRPAQVMALASEKIISAVAASHYTIALAENGRLYVWGACYYNGPAPWAVVGDPDALPPGVLADWQNRANEASKPRVVTEGKLGQNEGMQLDAGVEHWIATTREGKVYTASTGFTAEGVKDNDPGDLRWLGHTGPPTIPTEVGHLLATEYAVSSAAGRRASFAVLQSGKVVSWGSEDAGSLLGRSTDRMDAHFPAYVGNPDGGRNSLYSQSSMQVMAGEDYALVRVGEGYIYSWGRNRFGQLGRAALAEETEPGMVLGLGPFDALMPVAGITQAFAVVQSRTKDKPALLQEEEPEGAWAGGAVEMTDEEMEKAWGQDLKMSPEEKKQHEEEMAKVVVEQGGVFPLIWDENHKDEISQTAKDMLDMLPKEGFQKQYRNPCWNDPSAGGRLRCLPFFFILGASRAATQDLYNRLTNSGIPGILPSTERSPKWWDLKEKEGFAWYVSLFDAAANQIARQHDAITGEASSTMLTYSGIKVRGGTHTFLLPELLFSILPAAQMVVILRHPIDRMFSEYLMDDSLQPPNKSPQDFTNYVNTHLPVMEKCIAEEGGYKCSKKLYETMPHLCKSMYAFFLQDWLKIFARELFIFLKFEDYVKDTGSVLKRVLAFLDVDTSDVPREVWKKVASHPVQEPRKGDLGKLQVEGPTRDRLEKFFAPINEELMHLVGDKKYTWRP